MNTDRNHLIEKILEMELDMFLTVSAVEPASCREHPEEFKRHRHAQFSTWSDETLKSYVNDLMLAKQNGQNLMTLKYGRMEGLIPCLNDDPVIEKIVDAQYSWQKEMFEKYPNLMQGARAMDSQGDSDVYTSFVTYLRGELETYSRETLRLLYEDVKHYRAGDRNMSEDLYTLLVKSYGYQNLDEAEAALAADHQT